MKSKVSTVLARLAYFTLGVVCVASFAATFVSTKIYETTDSVTIGRTTSDKISLYGKTPIVQRSGSAQAAVSATVGAALATTAATTTTPYGFSQAQADGLIARVNALIVDNAAMIVLINEQRAALVALGVIKGSS